MGASAVTVVLARKWARALDHRQSCARCTSRARTGLSDIAQRRSEMFFVHGDGAEPALPEMTAAFAARLDHAGIAAMHTRQRAAQGVGIDGTRMRWTWFGIRHQRPHLDAGRAAMLGEQVAIKRIIVVAEEDPRAAIAALGHVMRMTGMTTRARRAMRHSAREGEPSQLSALSP